MWKRDRFCALQVETYLLWVSWGDGDDDKEKLPSPSLATSPQPKKLNMHPSKQFTQSCCHLFDPTTLKILCRNPNPLWPTHPPSEAGWHQREALRFLDLSLPLRVSGCPPHACNKSCYVNTRLTLTIPNTSAAQHEETRDSFPHSNRRTTSVFGYEQWVQMVFLKRWKRAAKSSCNVE